MLFRVRKSRWEILEAKIDLLLAQRPEAARTIERLITVEKPPEPEDGSIRYDPDTGEKVFYQSDESVSPWLMN